LIAIPRLHTFVEKSKMRGRRTLEETAAMIEHRRSSGLTILAFCDPNNVHISVPQNSCFAIASLPGERLLDRVENMQNIDYFCTNYLLI